MNFVHQPLPTMEEKLSELKDLIQAVRDQRHLIDSMITDQSTKSTRSTSTNIDALKQLNTVAHQAFEFIDSIINTNQVLVNTISNGIIEKVTEKVAPTIAHAALYSSVVKRQHHQHNNDAPRHLANNFVTLPPKQTETIMISTKNESSLPASSIPTMVQQEFKHKVHKIKVVNVFRTMKGAGIECITDSTTTTDNIIKAIKQDISSANNCDVFIPTPSQPNIVIENVSKDTDLSTMIDDICEQNNLNKEGFLYLNKLNNDANRRTRDVFCRITPETFQAIHQKGNQLYVGFQLCKVRKRVFVDQCQHCLQFGHKKINCPDKGNPPICPCCGKKESSHTCTKTKQPTCPSCAQHKYHKNKPHEHRANHMSCPIYKQRHDNLEKRVQYFPSPPRAVEVNVVESNIEKPAETESPSNTSLITTSDT